LPVPPGRARDRRDDASDVVGRSAGRDESRAGACRARTRARLTLTRKEMGGSRGAHHRARDASGGRGRGGRAARRAGVVPAFFRLRRCARRPDVGGARGYYEPSEKTMYLASDLGRSGRRDRCRTSSSMRSKISIRSRQLLAIAPTSRTCRRPFTRSPKATPRARSSMSCWLRAAPKATDLPESLLGVQVRAAANSRRPSSAVPDILKRSLVAPYVDGIGLVHFLRRRGGWAGSIVFWKDPRRAPSSSFTPRSSSSRAPRSSRAPGRASERAERGDAHRRARGAVPATLARGVAAANVGGRSRCGVGWRSPRGVSLGRSLLPRPSICAPTTVEAASRQAAARPRGSRPRARCPLEATRVHGAPGPRPIAPEAAAASTCPRGGRRWMAAQSDRPSETPRGDRHPTPQRLLPPTFAAATPRARVAGTAPRARR